MAERPLEILLADDDQELAEMITSHLPTAITARVTHVRSVEEALREELTCRHDLVIASLQLDTSDGFALIRQLRGKCRPFILLADAPGPQQLIEGIRLGVLDVLCKPFDMVELAEAVERYARMARRRRRERIRHRRLRRVTARIVGERRDLRQRMDLICRDFVQAYRRLAQKVVESGVLTQEPGRGD